MKNLHAPVLRRRRSFLKATGVGTLALMTPPLNVMAGPFTRDDFESLVPADKRLSPDWVKSLFARGTPEVYRGEDLEMIGMPVGGICAGQLYLGGDGKLWHWDIFNMDLKTGGTHYAKPMEPQSPLKQNFSLTIDGKTRTLDKDGFTDIRFRGEYPMARVEYFSDDVAVTLEAFSPFIPLNTDDSSLPATVMQFTVKNTSDRSINATLTGSLENAVVRSAPSVRRNRNISGTNFTFLECSAEKPGASEMPRKPDVVFEDWSKGTYGDWKVEGAAFGSGPIRKSDIPKYQGDVGGDSNCDCVANSHACAPGTNVQEKDKASGKLATRRFKIEHSYMKFWIGGGAHKGRTSLNLIVDGKIARSASGKNTNKMTLQHFNIHEYKGKEAVITIVDKQEGSWGNIGVGKITFTDSIKTATPFEELPDNGTMGLALLDAPAEVAETDSLGRTINLAAGQSGTVTFVLAWHFPNLKIRAVRDSGRYYATKFDSALSVAKYVAENFNRLASQTRLWRDTWYDSTLPYWFLDRTQLNTSILASSTCCRFESGRFWGWEGVGCCAGTCTHVWHYAHAVARMFPELERTVREQVDFGLALQPDGGIYFRGERNTKTAVDGQAGSVLRALREHQMSADDAFLKRVWPGVKRATEWLIAEGGDFDGIIEGKQHNTLDRDWFGPVAWLSGLYLAALEAAAVMADEMGDAAFAKQCRGMSARGQKYMVEQLFDGEYFINKPDPQHLDAVNSGNGCEIDQVMGQSWAWQVGLPRVFPEKETKSALRSLWKYNFTPDVGPYREHYTEGRWYAMAGEAGLLMCTFPRPDWDYEQAKGVNAGGPAGYLNECMNGFEYQVAGHMVWEGMLEEGLAITRAVHDRYHPSRRNPYNEIECGDHYARSMASYGVYLAACGFEYHGPKAHIGFAPRMGGENFKAAFTGAEGWGTFSQSKRKTELEVKYGKLRIKTISLAARKVTSVTASGQSIPFRQEIKDGKVLVTLETAVVIPAGRKLEVNGKA